ncbi:CatB-related O-acetyltransferase [Vibrio diabolicus]|uniref:CatB-related O-acetyltransferase n=1 Tax=Vibrio diabolicus TaxID=50719 RepID=UPI002494ECFC|nr:CatB-related O-acetyltransferase [Vibrio diabolicus]
MNLIKNIISNIIRKNAIKKKGLGIKLSRLCYIDSNSRLEDYVIVQGNSRVTKSKIGSFTYLSDSNIGRCNIGKFCSIAKGTKIGGLGAHPTDCISTHPVFYSSDSFYGDLFVSSNNTFSEHKTTTVGNNVWIGERVIVLDGVVVGDGAILAAGAVVTKDVEPYSIVGGVPAKLIRKRFSESDIELLRKTNWFELEAKALRKLAPLLSGANVQTFIKAYEEIKYKK